MRYACLAGQLVLLAVAMFLQMGTPTSLRADRPPASGPHSRPAESRPAASQPIKGGLKTTELDLGSGIKIKLVQIPPGKFMMGRDISDIVMPAHEVTLTKTYYMSIYTVTQEQYEQVVPRARIERQKHNPGVGQPQFPQSARWIDAVEYCKKVSQLTGNKVRLPTEAEWEYACRAGTTTRYFFGDNSEKLGEYACVSTRMPVGQKKPNPWGLYDMYENYSGQWCSDIFGPYTKDKATDPTGPKPKASGRAHVARGGFCGSSISRCWNTEDLPLYIRVVVEAPLVLPKEVTRVFKVNKLGHGKFLDASVDTAKVTAVPADTPLDLVIPNKPSTAEGPDPIVEIHKPIKDANKDDLLKIKYTVLPGNVNLISSAERYAPKPGEDQPNVFVYSSKTSQKLASGAKQPAIVATKYLQESQFLVPMRLTNSTQRAPDAAMMKVIDTLKEGDMIEVKLEGKTIKSIERYTPKQPTTKPIAEGKGQ